MRFVTESISGNANGVDDLNSVWTVVTVHGCTVCVDFFNEDHMSVTMDSPPTDEIIEEKERKLRLRNRVLNEIISSEESYIKQLEMLLNVSQNEILFL